MNERFSLTLESSGEHIIPAATRLRAVLKLLLRGYSFRVVEAREIAPEMESVTAAENALSVADGTERAK